MEQILDHITFAKMDLNEINLSSPDNILKVFKIFQCGVEYLIYSQHNLVMHIDEYEKKLKECYSVFTKMSYKIKQYDEREKANKINMIQKEKTIRLYEKLLQSRGYFPSIQSSDPRYGDGFARRCGGCPKIFKSDYYLDKHRQATGHPPHTSYQTTAPQSDNKNLEDKASLLGPLLQKKEKEIDELKNLLNEQNEKIKELEKEISKLQIENKYKTDELNGWKLKENYIINRENEMKDLEKLITDLKAENERLKYDIETNEIKINEYKKRIEDLENQINLQQKDIINKLSEISKLNVGVYNKVKPEVHSIAIETEKSDNGYDLLEDEIIKQHISEELSEERDNNESNIRV